MHKATESIQSRATELHFYFFVRQKFNIQILLCW